MSDNNSEQLTDYPELLTVEEVTSVLQTDLADVLRLTASGALPVIEIGTRIRRYRREDVHHYLLSRRGESGPTVG